MISFFIRYYDEMIDNLEINIVLLLRKIISLIELDSRKLSTQFNSIPAQLLALHAF